MTEDAGTHDPALAAVAELELSLGIRAGFFRDLLDEDDWSFTIKLHALVEATVSHLLTAECNRPELLDVFGRLPISKKLTFASALSCLTAEDLRVIRMLSEIRNTFAHDVACAGLTLSAYVESAGNNTLDKARLAFGPETDVIAVSGRLVPAKDFVRHNLKLAMWIATMFTIALAHQRKKFAMARSEFHRRVAAALLPV